ncbi:TPA_asm: DUF1642 domain-containing protein [Listeria monocytogenes]|nr:DUF1642 domain-containing protein [Listeria monocytogenes]EAC5658354.1 DUF1642 domain-containing protein [Listeria monocytogenes]EAD0733577.1 DUF1642 domain-containing protein [Listeria monocytogenes]EAD1417595.1 DUF1642 domain-containing protein [Listeria monocytogenes]EAD2117392.1 DUF1642 domain-containing protein [Listeria monocytogenes]
MRLKEGDKAEFVYGGKLTKGVVTEIKASPFGISYLMTFDENNKTIWVAEDLLLSPAPVLKVPQFVADWISHCKQREYDLACLLDYVNTDMHGEMNRWLILSTDNQETLARAWLDGYEVEKEPLYYVKFVDANNGNKCYLNVRSDGCKSLNNSVQNDIFKTQFTEGEIGEIDERYWQFAVPVRDLEGEDNE